MSEELQNEKVTEEVDEQQPTAEEPEQDTEQTSEEDTEEKSFTESEVNKIVQERLARAEKRREKAVEKEREEAERSKLEEQEEYKQLAETYRKELDDMKQSAIDTKKDVALTKAGYSETQVEKYKKYVSGEDDETIQASIDGLKEDIMPEANKVAFPNPMNGAKDKPEKVDASEIGHEAYARIKNRIK